MAGADPMVVVDGLHVRCRGYRSGAGRGTAAARALRLVRRPRPPSGVGDFINLAMKTYSSGMGSRLRFAIASAKSQDILLVDEALATGDAEFRVKSHRRINELREQAGTVFLVAHNLGEIEETCNRVIWLEKGQVVRAGPNVAEIVDAYLEATGGQHRVREPASP